MSIGIHDLPDGREKEIGVSCRTENWKYIYTIAYDGIKEEISQELYCTITREISEVNQQQLLEHLNIEKRYS